MPRVIPLPGKSPEWRHPKYPQLACCLHRFDCRLAEDLDTDTTMGLLVDGEWQDKWYDTAASGGRFEREGSRFRNWITRDGEPGPTGDGGFEAEAGRYHLYISFACPWSQRTHIFWKLKALEKLVSLSVTHWYMGEHGWTFADAEGVVKDPVLNATFLYQIYQAADPAHTGRATLPVLWDLERNVIVNNESADIVRMFNSAFDGVGAGPGDYYPRSLQDEIDSINERVYATVNNGVYKCGFATTQEAYEEALEPLFETLEWIDKRLVRTRYLTGNRITEADWRLFATLVRFDPVYFGHFKCNRKRVVDFEHIWPYVRDLYQTQGIADTVHLDHIKAHYYMSHKTINPTGIVPVGPDIDFAAKHERHRLATS
jgi:putative glutathione S-transferase